MKNLTLILALPLAVLPCSLHASEPGFVDSATSFFLKAKGTGEAWHIWNRLKKGDKKAFADLQTLASQDNGTAQNYLGFLYDHGQSVPQDSRRAAAYFRAAAGENPLAAYNLGLLSLQGRGIAKNREEARELFRRAAEKGNITQAMVRLILLSVQDKDYAAAWTWAQKAAEHRNRIGIYFVGRMLLDGTAPRRDTREAFRWLSKAAELYSPEAARLLSYIYANGQGQSRNDVMASGWAMIAAGMDNRPMGPVGQLSESDQQKARSFATNWLSSHRKPPHVEYEKTLAEPSDMFGR